MKLNQTIALEEGVKTRTFERLTKAHHQLQKPDLLSGMTRTYTPKDEDGEQIPPERKNVQVHAQDVIRETTAALTELFDVTATKDWANCSARADVVVDGQTLLKDVPVTYLLFLEKKLVDLHTFIEKLPALDPAEDWRRDENTGLFVTEPVQKVRTKKTKQKLVLFEPTEHQPGQAQVYDEDVPVGTWTERKFSSALPAPVIREYRERVEKLQRAVKLAREEANSAEAPSVAVGEKVLGYLFR